MNKKHDRSRRVFLKLTGCSLAMLPVALIATDRASAQVKAKKAAVNYQDTPNNGQKCVDCQLFEPPNACIVVEGDISPEGWCSLFVLKQGGATQG
ncbi:high-potential iron-sulfur protein [Microbulbifer sp. 2205BS26-8]|uniref:high-potential iron-sulfur protein n=1 Tax=Microbulbifer sp. 2205BS26-8 TaxID=3064386 RepID=UPI00273D2F1F|nr:high-potential iron-sulfur protein [Microbulbifer sp. 2205BS26-8]MDP5209390.1 high-potential iron-sulfur protein [Microbulbifer sp. 2205BS26-8]